LKFWKTRKYYKNYAKKVLSESIDFLNERNVFKTILERHNLMGEAYELLHKLFPDYYDLKGNKIDK
jgi:hypothetical protein